MVQCSTSVLDLSFAALADATRRGIIEHLGRTDASISGLADRFRMTLTGIRKHVHVLEQAGLVVTRKVGRVRMCSLGSRGLEGEEQWIAAHAALFTARFDRLDAVINDMKQEQDDGSAE